MSKNNAKHSEKVSEELMPVAWHPKTRGIFACQRMRKKKKQFLLSNAFSAHQ